MACKKLKTICAFFLLALAIPIWAADLSTEVRKGANNPHAGDGNFVELGLSAYAFTSPYYGFPEGSKKNELHFAGSLDLNLHLQYKGWFMEGFSQSLEHFTLGYNFANGEQWSLDAVGLEQHPELSKDESHDLKGLKKREADYMFGLRATGYYGDYIVQLHVLNDISEVHNGQVYSAKVARHWQYRNWNFHAIAGTSYRSEKVADYYLSVSPEDANEKFHEFRARAGFTHVFELGATYPISQKWVFRSLIRHIELDDQWTGSPLILSSYGDVLINSISYVF